MPKSALKVALYNVLLTWQTPPPALCITLPCEYTAADL